MSWTGPGPAIHIRGRSDACRPVLLTSVSLVWIPATVEGCCDTLRMYGVDVGDVEEALRVVGDGCLGLSDADVETLYDPLLENADCDTDDRNEIVFPRITGGRAPDGRVQYLDATGTSYVDFSPTTYEFWIDEAEARSYAPLLRSTCVPRHRYFPSYYQLVNNYTCTKGPATELQFGPAVSYQEGLSVLRLPDGRWLMLLQRRTTMVTDGWEPTSFSDVRGMCEPDCTMSDIVAYVADDAGFSSGLVGPFRIVDGRKALPDGTFTSPACVAPRLNVGVPGGVVVGDDLYVYYAVWEASNFDDRLGDGTYPPCSPSSTGGDLFGVDVDDLDVDEPPDLSTGPGRQAYVEATRGFRAGIAVKRISLTALYANFDSRRFPAVIATRAHLWDKYLDDGTDLTVVGELLGMVRFWIRDPDFSFRFSAFASVACEGGKPIDPSPVLCGEVLSLYFPLSSCVRADWSAALWRATAFRSTDAPVPADMVYGRDFLIDVTQTSTSKPEWSSDDRIPFPSLGQYVNPEVIQMPDRTWLLVTSGNLFTGAEEDGGCEV